MKKLLLLVALSVSLGQVFALQKVSAEPVLTPSSTSAIADGSAAITFTYTNKFYRCTTAYDSGDGFPDEVVWSDPAQAPNCSSYSRSGGPVQNLGPIINHVGGSGPIRVAVSGSGNIASASTLTHTEGVPITFTLKSTVAETKTVSMMASGMGGEYVWGTATVTFTAPPKASAPVAKPAAPTPTASAPTTTASAASAVPVAPTAASIMLAGETVDTAKPVTVEVSKPLVLSGKTVPNGIVTLTIHSKPRTVTVKADGEGNWSYTVESRTLETGKHTVYAKVTDPVTNQTSPESTLMSFTLAAAKTAAVSAPAKKNSSSRLLIPAAVAIALAAAGGGWFFWRRRQA